LILILIAGNIYISTPEYISFNHTNFTGCLNILIKYKIYV